jgi:hypothetical protein
LFGVIFLGAVIYLIANNYAYLMDRELWYTIVCIVWFISVSGMFHMLQNGSPLIGQSLIEPGMYDQNMIEGYLYAGLCIGFSKMIIDAIEMVKTEKDVEERRKN